MTTDIQHLKNKYLDLIKHFGFQIENHYNIYDELLFYNGKLYKLLRDIKVIKNDERKLYNRRIYFEKAEDLLNFQNTFPKNKNIKIIII